MGFAALFGSSNDICTDSTSVMSVQEEIKRLTTTDNAKNIFLLFFS
ncbi:hypothetical protein WKV44_09335 [Spirochaetia bacterium 38H-sp]|uniref:Uncharacterized protein n=1 Tax=Rarispira pelagica TaxID=3141764 RepID=A0ABU9UDI9_9SPIR